MTETTCIHLANGGTRCDWPDNYCGCHDDEHKCAPEACATYDKPVTEHDSPALKAPAVKVDDYGAWPRSEEQFVAYVREQLDRKHDYETSAQALTDVAVAAFNYASHAVGATGFQASWAGLRVLAKVNGIDGPFGIIEAEDLMYPQGQSPIDKAIEWSGEWREWAAEQARERMDEVVRNREGEMRWAHPNVWAHWLELAGHPEGYPSVEEMAERMAETHAKWDAEREAEGAKTND